MNHSMHIMDYYFSRMDRSTKSTIWHLWKARAHKAAYACGWADPQ